MTKYSAICCIVAIAVTLIGGMATSCNTSYDENEYTYAYSSTAITAFSLSANKNILNNLDSVFFSIDLNSGEIYNEQPLPYGTDISRMVLNIETDATSATEIIFKNEAGKDTTVTYSDNETDSIDFSNGPVLIHVSSYDGTAGRNYKTWINVYEEPIDSIYWEKQGNLPTSLTVPRKQKMVAAAGKYYMLTANTTGYSLASTDNPYNVDSWQSRMVSFDSFTPDIESLAGTADGKLYILDNDGGLHVSHDEASSWDVCNVTALNHIYGSYGTGIVGCYIGQDNKIYTQVYPGSPNPVAVPVDFPVSGTSYMVCMEVNWAAGLQGYIVGGRKKDGSLSGDTWGFDGQSWARISAGSLEEAEGRAVFPYTFSETDTTTWRTVERKVLVSIGGKRADNTIVKEVHYTNDMGVHWFKADSLKQLPPELAPCHSASVVVANHEIKASRAIRPITEWDAPYIYLAGGYDVNGRFMPNIWRGVLNYLTLKPLQ